MWYNIADAFGAPEIEYFDGSILVAWNVEDIEYVTDGFEKTFEVTRIALRRKKHVNE